MSALPEMPISNEEIIFSKLHRISKTSLASVESLPPSALRMATSWGAGGDAPKVGHKFYAGSKQSTPWVQVRSLRCEACHLKDMLVEGTAGRHTAQ